MRCFDPELQSRALDRFIDRGLSGAIAEIGAVRPTFRAGVVIAATPGRTFFVGDVHGMYALLDEALTEVGFDVEQDQLLMVGDLVDRGHRSLDTLALLDSPCIHSAVGNHELIWLNVLTGATSGADGARYLLNCGGLELLESLLDTDDLEAFIQGQLRLIGKMHYSMVYAHEGRTIGVTHAEPPEPWTTGRMMGRTAWEGNYIWNRDRFDPRQRSLRGHPITGVDAVVCGHTPASTVRTVSNVVCIDTGAFALDGSVTLLQPQAVLNAVENLNKPDPQWLEIPDFLRREP